MLFCEIHLDVSGLITVIFFYSYVVTIELLNVPGFLLCSFRYLFMRESDFLCLIADPRTKNKSFLEETIVKPCNQNRFIATFLRTCNFSEP